MKNVFDELAVKFTRDIDSDISRGVYLRGRLFLELAERTVPPGGRILDYGCGPGRLGLLLARSGFQVRGVDTAPAMIAQARRLDRQGLTIEFSTIRGFDNVPDPATYDAVVCSSVIEYVPDPRELLRDLHGALRDSGILIISYANKSSLYRWYRTRSGTPNPMVSRNHHVWDWPGFRTSLAQSGFRSIGRPQFFESPLDGRCGRFVRGLPFVGQLGLVAARRKPLALEDRQGSRHAGSSALPAR